MKPTPEYIESRIKGERYVVAPDGRTTVCMMQVANGHTLVGVSSVMDGASFDVEKGQKIARASCVSQLWERESYLFHELEYMASSASMSEVKPLPKERKHALINPRATVEVAIRNGRSLIKNSSVDRDTLIACFNVLLTEAEYLRDAYHYSFNEAPPRALTGSIEIARSGLNRGFAMGMKDHAFETLAHWAEIAIGVAYPS